jgi:hypothetical protein
MGSTKSQTVDLARSVAFRVNSEYFAWLIKVAKKDRSSLSALLDHAVVAYARQLGIEEEPPERY